MGGLVVALALLGLAVIAALGLSPARAVGPYPDLGDCSVFPDPPPDTPANATSLPTEAAWNQDIS